MALTAHATGTQTATISTEHSLTTAAVAGVFILEVDTNAMVSGDSLELRIKKKILTGGSARTYLFVRYDGAQAPDDLIKVSIPVNNELVEAGALDFTLKQIAGTGRAFPWKVLKHA